MVPERVGERVVGLPDTAKHRCNGRKQHEDVQADLRRGEIEIHGPRDFRCENGGDLARALANDEAIPENAGRVDYTVQPTVLPQNLTCAALHSCPVRNIHGTVLDRGLRIIAATLPNQSIPLGCTEFGSPRQDEGRAGRVAQDFSGPDSAEPTGATGDPVNALVLPGRAEATRLLACEWRLFEHVAAVIPVGNLHILRVCILFQQLAQSRGTLLPLQQDRLTADRRVFELGTAENRRQGEPKLCRSRV